MQFKTIIAAIDVDDDLAADVVKAAQSLAQKDDAQLEVVTVWPSLSVSTPVFSPEIAASAATISPLSIEQHKEARAEAQTRLDKLASEFAPGAKTCLRDGDPADEIASYAKTINADLIVTGSHQRKFWNRLLQGSASRELVSEAPCAVFLVTESYAAKLGAEG